jgi:hypothetical protein
VVSLSNHTENLPFDKLRANGIETIPEYFQENLTALLPGGESLSATVEVFHQYLPLSAPRRGIAARYPSKS